MLTCRSRLGCQVFLTKDLDGMVVKLPAATRNMYVDGEYIFCLPSPVDPVYVEVILLPLAPYLFAPAATSRIYHT